MKKLNPFALAGLLVSAAWLGACAPDPAADAPAATVSEPAADTDQPAADAPAATTAEATYNLTPPSSTIGFVGSKVTRSHDGGFEKFDGQVTLTGDTPETATVHVEIATASLWTDTEGLTKHLKSDEFFGVETYPSAHFTSTAITANDDGTYTITGNLDLHGVTKQISFPATIEMTGEGFSASAEFSIKRFDFGIVYPGKADDLIRDDVLIKLDLNASA